MYVSSAALEKPQVAGFMKFVLTNPQLVADTGYVALTEAEYQEGITALGLE
jgi:ABC-type phosphate transport system substrate-binding protein